MVTEVDMDGIIEYLVTSNWLNLTTQIFAFSLSF